MAAKRACRNLSQDLSQDLSQGLAKGPAMLRIKASCATSWDRNSRETKSALSGFTKPIRSGDDGSRDRAIKNGWLGTLIVD
jgi:hypothetical protein